MGMMVWLQGGGGVPWVCAWRCLQFVRTHLVGGLAWRAWYDEPRDRPSRPSVVAQEESTRRKSRARVRLEQSGGAGAYRASK